MHRVQSITVSDGLEEGDDLILAKGEDVYLKKDEDFYTRYEALEELGRGKFGIVQSCRDRLTNEIYAAKFIQSSEESKRETLDEILMMNKLHHKRLIRLQDAYENEKDLIIIMELVTGGELFEKVIEEDNLTEKQVVRYLRQIFFGLQHMHDKMIVHLDLKPENILCVSGYRPGYEELKLIDFGMAKQLIPGADVRVACGTPEFVAPEVISFQPISLASDMWSLGVIAYVLLSGLSPFMGETDVETLQHVAACEWDFDDGDEIFEHVSEDAKDFIRQFIVRDPKARLTINEAFQHPWCMGFEQASETRLNTKNLRKYVARRRWHKTRNAFKALRHFGSMFQSRRQKPNQQKTVMRGKLIHSTEEIDTSIIDNNNNENKVTNDGLAASTDNKIPTTSSEINELNETNDETTSSMTEVKNDKTSKTLEDVTLASITTNLENKNLSTDETETVMTQVEEIKEDPSLLDQTGTKERESSPIDTVSNILSKTEETTEITYDGNLTNEEYCELGISEEL